jgi:hypothetical protein
MRLIKMFGLAAVAAVTAMAFVGATSASAADTQLCASHTTLTCNGLVPIAPSMEQVGSGYLLGSGFHVKCDNFAGSGTPLALGSPQQIHIKTLSFTHCATNQNDGCQVTVLELPLASLTKTGLDAGVFTTANGEVLIYCEDVLFAFDAECRFDLTGVSLSAGAQHLTASKTPVDELTENFLCPDDSTLDGLLTLNLNSYILA